jgi:acyl-homoserine-lactone acylase
MAVRLRSSVAVRAAAFVVCLATLVVSHAVGQTPPPTESALAQQVEVRRTAYGVPHIKAQNLAAAAYALAYVQSEDYGARVALGLLRERGEMGKYFGRDSMETDFLARLIYRRAIEVYPRIERETREVYEGFAAGVNRYIELHPAEFPAGFAPRFNGYDVAAKDVEMANPAAARRFLARIQAAPPAAAVPGGEDPAEEGSNAWAFAPSRTKSGKAILLRNPHLAYDAGYYEAQMTVPGVVEFYGDFRIGGPFDVIGGFNRDLGWATTNNYPLVRAIYALDVDSTRVDHYLFQGASLPLERMSVTVEWKNGPGMATETREMWRTPLGPVIWRGNGKVYVLRTANDGDFRGGEQFLRMMQAHSLDEWKSAMRMRARTSSNFTYADRKGNIFYVWNAALPEYPGTPAGDSVALPARGTGDVWTRYVPWDSLPQLLNPKGGYLQNENDPPYFANMHQVLDWKVLPDYFPRPRLRLRSQMAITLIDTRQKLSLEDVIKLKYSYRMLLADRVRDDLVAAVKATNPTGDVAAAIDVIARWDKTAAPESRGGTLFEIWWRRYVEGSDADSMFAEPWTPDSAMTTPRGLKDPARAAQAFASAVAEMEKRYGSADVAWGDVHRLRIGKVDVPLGGCMGDLGCFRVIWYKDDPDGKREAVGGDGWILAMEFGDPVRAYSVLAYGESDRNDSAHHDDQAEMFARGELKPVVWLDKDVDAATVTRYHPGMDR